MYVVYNAAGCSYIANYSSIKLIRIKNIILSFVSISSQYTQSIQIPNKD